ncbi:MAG: HPr family phosphocarrier protein [Defluviitaleaceae bacterium]|nr:HPr family phosphocarrier protein [Defluviitaleaceae bacterium]
MKQFKYTIRDPLGIHARPAGLLVKEVSKFSSKITIANEEKTVDAKKIFSIMQLAVKQGQTVTITIEGDDEGEALQALEEFMEKTW